MNYQTRFWLLTEKITENAENSANNIDFSGVLVSFLYFLGALLLIYLVLVLVNKWGKKKQGQNKDITGTDENAVNEQAEKETDNKGEK